MVYSVSLHLCTISLLRKDHLHYMMHVTLNKGYLSGESSRLKQNPLYRNHEAGKSKMRGCGFLVPAIQPEAGPAYPRRSLSECLEGSMLLLMQCVVAL